MSAIPSEAEIAAELQYHPASSREDAWRKAEFALHLRAALLAEARRLGLATRAQAEGEAVRETEEESLIRQLLEREVRIADISDEACSDEYERHTGKFLSPALFEAAHILIAADMTSRKAREAARHEATRLAGILAEYPAEFARLAREHSSCPTAADGGALGQITARDVTPEIATMLSAMTPGTVCPVPVPTRHGYHLLRLDRRENGRDLPFDAVREQIRDRLRQRAWLVEARRYASTLINDAAWRGDGRPSSNRAQEQEIAT